MPVRDSRALAHRIFVRWDAYRRQHPGRSVAVDHALSRIFELVSVYVPYRERQAAQPSRRPPQRPGLFTIQRIADALGTTVGDLLGEEPPRLRDQVSDDERRALRTSVAVLRRLFDLDDPNL